MDEIASSCKIIGHALMQHIGTVWIHLQVCCYDRLVPLGYEYMTLGCETYLFTSTSLVSGRRYSMIVWCFYMSIPVSRFLM